MPIWLLAGSLLALVSGSSLAGEGTSAAPRPDDVIEARLLPREVKRQVAALERIGRTAAPGRAASLAAP